MPLPHADTLRTWVARTLATKISTSERSEPIVETILVRDGRYVGRAFRQAGWKVVWPAGEDLVQIFDPQGSWLGNVDIGPPGDQDGKVA
jgi:hypothetical protein